MDKKLQSALWALETLKKRYIIGSDESWPWQFNHFIKNYLDKEYCHQMLTLCNQTNSLWFYKNIHQGINKKKNKTTTSLSHYFQRDVIVKIGHIPSNLHFTSLSNVTQNCDESHFSTKLWSAWPEVYFVFLTQITQLLIIGIVIQFNFRTDLEILQRKKRFFFLKKVYCYCILNITLQVKYIKLHCKSKNLLTDFVVHMYTTQNILISILM